ncbi:hypothetical protein [Aquicoccus sp. SU-CL01552]|uniref:hypothetical protein n=1 Tax=Aquicoccus sp. SU-CL01552 TaxID=3127656 RepID=UPI0031097D5C
MSNAFASLTLLTWPLICLLLLRRLPLERAVIWCILGGYLLLPPRVEFDLPLVPPMDKTSIPNLSVLVIVVLVLGLRPTLWPKSRTAMVLVALYIFGAVFTVLTNGDPVIYSHPTEANISYRLPGLRLHDTLSVIVDKTIVLIPFLLGRQLLGSDKGLRELLLALAIGGLAYSLPALIEVRLSPQFNIWVYGFFQHSFEQMMRQGGFRPIVFLPHALWLALFMLSALLATAALTRQANGPRQVKLIIATIYLTAVLYLCKSLATQLYALAFLPMALFAGRRLTLRLTAMMALIAVSYPILRQLELIPLDTILERAAAIDPDRASSLGYRFTNEEILLERAREKPWFGWGGWGRNLLLNPESGAVETIPDGRWIIVFGTFGWLGYIAEMGLLALPLMLLWWRSRHGLPRGMSSSAAAVALILAVTMIDMLLNATLVPLVWMCAGALLGHAEQLHPLKARSDAPGPLFGTGPVIGREAGRKFWRQ